MCSSDLGGAHRDPDYAAVLLRNFIVDALIELRKLNSTKLLDERYRKFRRMGQVAERKEGFSRDLEDIQKRFVHAFDQIRYRFPNRHGDHDRGPIHMNGDAAASTSPKTVSLDQPR